MNEQPLDLRRMIRGVRKRWLLVLVLGWAGCLGGYLAASRQPPTYAATASVLLPPSPVDDQGDQTRSINTQANIAANGNILQRAGRAVNPPIGVRRMRKLIEVKALTADILEVRAEARSGPDAARLADAVAKEYVAEATDASSKLAGTAISGLEAQVAKVEARLQQTKADIDAATAIVNGMPASSPERLRQAAIIDSLQVEQVEAARQLASLGDRIAEARLEDQLNREGTRLLAPAIIPTDRSQPKPLVFTAGGALLGLMAGVLLALVRDRRDGRLRTRADISQVVAAPVLASLDIPQRLSPRVCRTMLERWEPRPSQAWVLRQACDRLGLLHGVPGTNLVVVGLPGDPAGPLVAVQLAVFAASMGTETTLLVASGHPTTAHLRSACHRRADGSEVRPCLVTHSGPVRPHEEERRPSPELTITVVIAEPDELANVTQGSTATLALSSGFANADTLAMTALGCLDAGLPLQGLFLANPDPSDQTVGELAPGSGRRDPEPQLIPLEARVVGALEQGQEAQPGRELGSSWDEGPAFAGEADNPSGNGAAEDPKLRSGNHPT